MNMGEKIFFSKLITKDLTAVDSNRRLFEGVLTVEMKDKQNEITIRDELLKVLPVWIARGGPITDTHSNRVVGKGINFAATSVTDDDGNTYPAITIQGEIFKDYELDDEIWKAIKDGTYKGLSFGGATKSDRRPVMQSDGSIAYALKDLEQYEVAVCEDPAVPLALITQHNELAKAMAGYTEPRNGGLIAIKCTKFGCYVDKDDIDKKDNNVDEGYGKLKNGEPFADVQGANAPEWRDAQSEAFKKDKKDKSSYGDHGDNPQDDEKAEMLEAQQSQGPNQDNGSTYRGTDKADPSDPDPSETDPKKIMVNAESAGRKGFEMYKGRTVVDSARYAEVEHASVDGKTGNPQIKAQDLDNKEMLEEADLEEEKKLEYADGHPEGPCRKHKGEDAVNVPSGKVKKPGTPSVLTSEQEYDKHIQRKRDYNDKVKATLDILNMNLNLNKKITNPGHAMGVGGKTQSESTGKPSKENWGGMGGEGLDTQSKEGVATTVRSPVAGTFKPKFGESRSDAEERAGKPLSNATEKAVIDILNLEMKVKKKLNKGGEEGSHTTWTEPARGGFAGREPGITRDDESRSIYDVNQPKHVTRPTKHEAADALRKELDISDRLPDKVRESINRLTHSDPEDTKGKLGKPIESSRTGSCGNIHPQLKAYLHDLERQLDNYQMKDKLRGALAHLDDAVKEHRDPQLAANNSEDGVNGKMRTNDDEEAEAFKPTDDFHASTAGSIGPGDVVAQEPQADGLKKLDEKIIHGKTRPKQVVSTVAESKANPAGWEQGESKQRPGTHPATDEHHEMVLGNVAPSSVAGSRHHSRAGGISHNSDPSELEEQGGVVGGIITQREAVAGKSTDTLSPGMGSGGVRNHHGFDIAQQDTGAKDDPRRVIELDYGGPTDSDNGGDNPKFNKAILDIYNEIMKLKTI